MFGISQHLPKCGRRIRPVLPVISYARTASMDHGSVEAPAELVSRRVYKYIPTPEEIAIARAKKAERKKKQIKEEAPDTIVAQRTIIPRPWLTIPTEDTIKDNFNIRVFTWNVSVC